MAHINFVIPQSKNELLSDNDEQFYVRNVVSVRELQPKLQEAKHYLKDDGPEYIFETFVTYYSVLHHDTVQVELLMQTYQQLHKAAQGLNNVVGFLLEDKDSLDDETKMKFLNMIKMLLYIYTQVVAKIDHKIEMARSHNLLKGRPKKHQLDDNDGLTIDRKAIVLILNNILQRELAFFWDPPVMEESFTNMIAEICYRFLEVPTIKVQKELRVEVFNLLGTLVKSYNHGMTFVVRIVQLIKMKEHLVACIPEGIQILVESYNCKSLVRDFIREVTEWQTDENFQDAPGTKNCSNVLCEMANLMPDLMIPEVMYLNRYLAHESYTLRNSVLQVISEIILTVLTKSDLSDEQKECRDEFLSILEEHIDDVSAHVRAKVFQQWARLQQDNAIPLKIQTNILEKAVVHLRDKAANVRKCAANCVTTFLSHNIYGARLHLDQMESELELKLKSLDELKEAFNGEHMDKIREIQEQWETKVDDMKAVIAEKIKEGNIDEPSESQIAKKDLPELVRSYIIEGRYADAFEICHCAVQNYPQWMEARSNLNEEQQGQIFLILIREIFTDINDESENNQGPTETQLKELETMELSVDYLRDAVHFLKLIDSAIGRMVDLLESASTGDMQEAVEFFISAFQFNINNAITGILEMLKIMQRSEVERKDIIIKAFQTIFLRTDSTNMRDHTTTIIDRLIRLLQIIPFEKLDHFNMIVSEWVSNGTLDNGIIDMLWQYFTKKVEVSDDMSRAALHLLGMAAMGRRTIVSKNIKLISAICFGERGKTNILLVTAGCRILQVAGCEKQDITDKNPPFRIKVNDPIWKDLKEILIGNFYAETEHYNVMMGEAIGCIYKLCSKPEKLCESLIENIINSIHARQSADGDLPGYVIAQCAHIIGEVALKQLRFLDEAIYKELKRRQYIREELKSKKKGKDKPKTLNQNSSAIRRMASLNSSQSVADESNTADESIMEGAQAEDADAEFILNTLEYNTVGETSGLGKLAYILVGVCERPQIYDDFFLQTVTINALLRFMTVSMKFCEKNIQLIFTILEKTTIPEVKSNILIHCSDLLERFPNIIEPWTPKLYERLRDSCNEVRVAAFFMLAHLILQDMMRVQGHVSEMACCIVDDQIQLREMSKNFFTQLSHRANNLYNVLPDIFSHLSDHPKLEEENLKLIMKFLFGLIDKNKQMENLVDRFCAKFRLSENDYKCRNIAYCLTLIQYNDKGLRRLLDSFSCYKNSLHNNDVYASFKQILNTCSKSTKNEIKELGVEIEKQINSVFEVEENGQPRTPRPNKTPARQAQPKTAFKKPRGRAPRKKAAKKNQGSDNSDDSDEAQEKENTTPLRRTVRTKRQTPQPVSFIDDSDSD